MLWILLPTYKTAGAQFLTYQAGIPQGPQLSAVRDSPRPSSSDDYLRRHSLEGFNDVSSHRELLQHSTPGLTQIAFQNSFSEASMSLTAGLPPGDGSQVVALREPFYRIDTVGIKNKLTTLLSAQAAQYWATLTCFLLGKLRRDEFEGLIVEFLNTAVKRKPPTCPGETEDTVS